MQRHQPTRLNKFLRPSLLGLSCSLFAFAASAETLRLGLTADINTLDPHMTASVATDLSVLSHIYPALVLREADMAVHPSVATAWEAVDDLTWRFTLRDGAKFANGEAIDAAAVKWNIDRVLDANSAARIKSWFASIAEVSVLDAATLEIKTSAPFPAMVEQLSMFLLLPPVWAATNDPASATMPGGEYVLEERVPGSSITLAANPDYWGEPNPFDKVIFQVIPEEAARSASVQTGEVDFVAKIPVLEVDRLAAEGTVEAGAIASTRNAFLKLNTEKAPLQDRAVRQALNYAVDKEGIAAALFSGRAALTQCQVITSDYFGFNPDLQDYAYDPDKALELLKEANFDFSQTIELEVPVAIYVQAEEVIQVVAAQYEALGLNVKITEMSWSTYLDKMVKAHDLAQVGYLTFAWPTIDADGVLSSFAPGNAYDFWNNAEFGALVEAGRSTTDKTARLASYKEASELLCEEAPAVFLFNQPLTYATSKRVVWQARGDDWLRARDFKLN